MTCDVSGGLKDLLIAGRGLWARSLEQSGHFSSFSGIGICPVCNALAWSKAMKELVSLGDDCEVGLVVCFALPVP